MGSSRFVDFGFGSIKWDLRSIGVLNPPSQTVGRADFLEIDERGRDGIIELN